MHSERLRVAVNGIELFVHVIGPRQTEGSARRWLASAPELPVVLALHGGPGGDHRALVPPLGALGSECFVLFVDLRGHGLSSRPAPSECTLEQMADDLAALQAALGLAPRRLNVLGVSFGASVALTFARRAAEGCARLMLSAAVTSFRADDDWVATVSERGTLEQAHAAQAITSGTLPTLAALRAAQALVRPLFYADPVHPSASTIAPTCADEGVPAESLELVNWWYRAGRQGYDVEPFLAHLRAPTLVLSGCADPLGTPAQAHTLATAIPGARLELFPHSGHLPQVEEAVAFRQAIRTFIGLEAAA